MRETDIVGIWQVAEEAARRCFRDNLLSKAVRECGSKPSGVSSLFTNSNVNVTQRRLDETPVAEFRHTDRAEETSNNSASHSMDESSSSEEALSRRSASPPLSIGMEQHANQHKFLPNGDQADKSRTLGTVVQTTCGRITYLSNSARVNDTDTTRFTEATTLTTFHDSSSTMSNSAAESPGDIVFQNDHCENVHRDLHGGGDNMHPGVRARHLPPRSMPPRTDTYTRWLASRNVTSSQHENFPSVTRDFNSASSLLPLSRFSMEVQGPLAQCHGEAADHMQNIAHDIARPQAGTASTKMDKGNPRTENLGFQQGLQEMQGYRSYGGPGTPGLSGSILDITAPHMLSNYSGAVSSFGPGGIYASFNGPLAGSPTGMRLHEYEVPSPRMVLWDFQE